MTNIGHFRAAGELLQNYDKINTTLWVAPPTKMDEQKLKDEGYYDIFKKIDTNIEMPGCSLCMGNQARVKDNSFVLSTSASIRRLRLSLYSAMVLKSLSAPWGMGGMLQRIR